MKKIYSLFLSITLLISATGAYAARSETSVRDPFPHKITGDTKTVQQLKELHELGMIQESTQKKDEIELEHPESFELLDEGSYLVAIDTNSHKQIKDLDRFIKTKKEERKRKTSTEKTSNIAPESSALLFYEVHFVTGIGDPDTWYAELFHSAEVTSVYGVGTRPSSYTIISKFHTATSRYGSYSLRDSVVETVPQNDAVELVEAIYTTNYWKLDSVVYANFPGVSSSVEAKQEGPWLINFKGLQYPLDYRDPQSGIRLYEPPTNLSVNPQTRSNTYRDDFKKYYESNWGQPTYFMWSQVDIHHMRPLQYGGSNSNSNLIPLMNFANSSSVIQKHDYLTKWWNAY